MPRTGTLRIWHDDRGFGFIAPGDGGRELFVHISAFPKDGSRPTEGESLSFEVGTGKDGKPQAIQVRRRAFGDAPPHSRARPVRSETKRSVLVPIVALLLICGIGAAGYSRYRQVTRPPQAASQPVPATAPAKATAPDSPGSARFRCDGRTHCSHMTSCTEAKFFLANCPGTKMDGNNDGVPCEQQWCTSPLAR